MSYPWVVKGNQQCKRACLPLQQRDHPPTTLPKVLNFPWVAKEMSNYDRPWPTLQRHDDQPTTLPSNASSHGWRAAPWQRLITNQKRFPSPWPWPLLQQRDHQQTTFPSRISKELFHIQTTNIPCSMHGKTCVDQATFPVKGTMASAFKKGHGNSSCKVLTLSGSLPARRLKKSITKSHYTIPYYTILYYTVLYSTILHCYYTILYYTILYYTILYYTILYYTILYYTTLYYTILYDTVLYVGAGYLLTKIPDLGQALTRFDHKASWKFYLGPFVAM